MGQIVKQVSNHSTRYYWYPGDKKEWLRGLIAIAAGVAAFVLLHLLTHGTLLPAVVGTSITAAMAGVNFGRRDSRELARFAELAKTKPARRQTAVHTGRAMWRGVAEGTGGAAAAVLIVNLRQRGVGADWLLPLVPAIVGALAHQIGGMYEHLGTTQSTVGPAKRAAAAAIATQPPRVATGRATVVDTRATVVAKRTPRLNLSPLHPPVVLPPDVSTVVRPKPLMPLSAAIAARKDVAEIAVALGTHAVAAD